jgi:hypothetical protein
MSTVPCLTLRLIQAQNAQLPQVVAEHVSFIEQQFAPDYFVARPGVAGEIDAPDEELFLLVEGEGQIDRFGVVVHFRIRHGSKIDETEISVQLGVVLDRLADFGHAEDLAFLDGENRFQIRGLEKEAFIRIRIAHVERAHVVSLALFDGYRDVCLPALVHSHQRNAFGKHPLIDGYVLNDRVLHQHFEISVVLIDPADSDFHVLIQLGAVKRLGQHRDKVWRHRPERYGGGPGIAHGAYDFAGGESGVSRDENFADLHLGAFIDVEGELYGVRAGEPFKGGLDGGELAAVLCEQLFKDDFRFLDARGIKLAFNREADLAVLESVEDVGFRYRFVALVFDAADDRALGHIENDDLLVWLVRAVLNLEPEILEILRVPQGVKVAPEGILVHRVTGPGKNARSKSLAANPSITLEFDALDGGRSLRVFGRRLLPGLTGERTSGDGGR